MATGIGLVISATDQATATIDKITARLAKFNTDVQRRMNAATAPFKRLGASMAKFSDVSGLSRVAGAMRGLARAGADAYQKVGQFVPLIGIIGSAATVAGITRMVNAWTEWGSRIGFASQRIRISADKLSAFQSAARLAGASSESATSGLQALGQTMYDAIGGRAPEAIVMFRTLGIAFQDTTGHARSVVDVLPEVADKIRSIRDPYAQAQVAATLFGGAAEDLLPFLRKGAEGIREYVGMAQRYGVFTDASAAAANRLREAQARVSLAVEGLRNKIAERLEPIITPLLQHFAEWVATSPQIAQGVAWLGEKVNQLGRFIENGGLQQFGATLQHWGDVALGIAGALGGPQKVVERLIDLMTASFALKVITPFLTLGTAIVSTTAKLTVLTAGMARMGVGGAGLGMLGRLGGLLGGLGLAGAYWEGANWLGGATAPQGNGLANLFHNMIFEADPRNWTQSYHAVQPGGEGAHGGGTGGALGKPDGSGAGVRGAPTGDMAAREKQAYDYFTSQGRSPQAAAGIVASLERESLGNERNNTGDGGQAYGIGQWHADRQEHFRQIFGRDIRQSTFGEQLLFKRMELDGNGGDTGSARAGQMMQGATSARAAGALDSRYAERPGDTAGEMDRRGALAEEILRRQLAATPRAPAQPQGAPMPTPVAPAAQGAPMVLNTGPSANDNRTRDPADVRLHITGQDGYRANVVSNPQGVAVAGPLVERPQLLGALP